VTPIRIASVEAFAFRAPITAPIKVAFGTFRDRPVVYVRVVDADAGTSHQKSCRAEMLARREAALDPA